ncbi:MAG: 5'-methylthioadenosine/adenosylhomocysteine nucleosidase [Clostridia bacterium]|nr:5'-methylthioadenosine/adenosylhomocysteine nucleosidase [Clostridia bacterium]
MKKGFVLITAVLVVAVAIFGFAACDKNNENNAAGEKQYIGIISAMDNEIAALVEDADIEREETVGGEKYYVGKLRGQNVVITKSGIGKVFASSGATILLDNYNIEKLIFTGIAGGVADGTDVLDEIVATSLVEHDYGIITNDGFEWRSGDPGFGNKPGEYYECDKALVDIAYNAAVKVLGAEFVHKGTIATGDQFIASEDYVAMLQTKYNAVACEMEGASVAKICIRYGVPFVVIRALSDKADGKAHESYADFGDIAA